MTTIVFTTLYILCVLLGFAYLRAATRAEDARAERERLEGWVTHNLRSIRIQIAYGFPEAVAVCDALEKALPARGKVPTEVLEKQLLVIRRKHNRDLLEAAGYGVSYAEELRSVFTQIAVAAHALDIPSLEAHAHAGLALLRGDRRAPLPVPSSITLAGAKGGAS